VYEDPGNATIKDKSSPAVPYFVSMYYTFYDFKPFVQVISEGDTIREDIEKGTITYETQCFKFVFLRKDGVLIQMTWFGFHDGGKKWAFRTYEFSNHIECSGIWMPLRITVVSNTPNGEYKRTTEISVDKKSLRLLDTIDDSCFRATMPPGCVVSDKIQKKDYIVTSLETLPNDIEAVKQALEKLLEQAEEQEAAVEKKK
jgi:hypothetical protein